MPYEDNTWLDEWPALKSGGGNVPGVGPGGGGFGTPGGSYAGSNPTNRKLGLTEILALRKKFGARAPSPDAGGSGGELPPEVLAMLAELMGAHPMALGGIVRRPTFAMLGERGPEAVVPLGQHPGWGAGMIQRGQQAAVPRQPQQSSTWLRPGAFGGQYQPQAPAAQSPTTTLGGSWQGDLGRLVNSAGDPNGADLFNPMGSQGTLQAVRRDAEMRAQGQQGQALTAARYFAGSDPSAAGYAGLSSSLQGMSNVSNAVSGADLAQRMAQQEFYRQILEQYFGGRENQDIARTGQQSGTNWGGLAGGVGSLVGAFVKH